LPGNNTIQVYEYSWLIVNEKYGPGKEIIFEEDHYKLLAKYLTNNPGCKYFTVYLNRIRLSSYVGVIKVKNLTIEILPKTDRHVVDENIWQKVLIQMLAISMQVKATTTTHADIVLRNHSVLETYLYLFLKETEVLLHHGLVKKYRTNISNQTALKGKLLIHQHVSKNLVHAEQFFVAHQVYDRDNIYNAILQEALFCISSLSVSDSITKFCNKILLDFPECKPVTISVSLFEKLTYDRKTERYRAAIELARIILLNYHPDIKGGSNNILAIMFDMNLLWESYIFRMIAKARNEEKVKCKVLPQRSASFWKHPDKWTLHLIPDIVVEEDMGDTFILDTKWKYKSDTSIEDVRQMYAYGNYFGAKKRYLLYPDKVKDGVEKREGSFYDVASKKPSESERCGLVFIDLLKPDKTLNTDIGKRILEEIFKP
jgi:5-methylcytosine-specific restriction enzyme subunit McrC